MLNRLELLAKNNKRKLFLIDAIGAALSAFLLGVVLVYFNDFFGIPIKVLYTLAIPPIFFVVYDLIAYLQKNDKLLNPLLRGIAILNILYCILSITLTLNHINVITLFGWIYIINEIILVILIALFELKVSKD